MQRGREEKVEMVSSIQDIGGFGSHRSMMPSLFGERDPFDLHSPL